MHEFSKFKWTLSELTHYMALLLYLFLSPLQFVHSLGLCNIYIYSYDMYIVNKLN